MKRTKEILFLTSNQRLDDYYKVGPVQKAAVEDFADMLIKDILLVLAAHALSGDSATTAYANIRQLYEEKYEN